MMQLAPGGAICSSYLALDPKGDFDDGIKLSGQEFTGANVMPGMSHDELELSSWLTFGRVIAIPRDDPVLNLLPFIVKDREGISLVVYDRDL